MVSLLDGYQMEAVLDADKIQGKCVHNFVFKYGIMSLDE